MYTTGPLVAKPRQKCHSHDTRLLVHGQNRQIEELLLRGRVSWSSQGHARYSGKLLKKGQVLARALAMPTTCDEGIQVPP